MAGKNMNGSKSKKIFAYFCNFDEISEMDNIS